jgi:hypothetical protein
MALNDFPRKQKKHGDLRPKDLSDPSLPHLLLKNQEAGSAMTPCGLLRSAQ